MCKKQALFSIYQTCIMAADVRPSTRHVSSSASVLLRETSHRKYLFVILKISIKVPHSTATWTLNDFVLSHTTDSNNDTSLKGHYAKIQEQKGRLSGGRQITGFWDKEKACFWGGMKQSCYLLNNSVNKEKSKINMSRLALCKAISGRVWFFFLFF